MSHADKKLITRRYFEDAWNRGDRAVLEEIVSAHAVAHTAKGTLHGRSALEVRLGWLQEAFTSPSFGTSSGCIPSSLPSPRWGACDRRLRRSGARCPTGPPIRR